MTPQQFIAKWRHANLSERSACQQHFLDLCDLLEQPKPAEADPDGAFYTFERGVRKTAGGNGWADVWMRGHFGWEYKGKHKNLNAAYLQLLEYREDLENPPLLGRLRPRPLRNPHEFHEHAQADLRLRSGRPGRSGQPRSAPQALHRSRTPCIRASAAKRSPRRPPTASAIWPTASACTRASRRTASPTSS